MKTCKKIFLFAIAITTFLFVSCEEVERQVPPYLTPNAPTTINVPATGLVSTATGLEAPTITFSSNMGWTITSVFNSDWFSITQTSGEGSAIVPINVQPNLTTTARIDTILVTNETGLQVRRFPIIQAGTSLVVGSIFSYLEGASDSVRVDTIGVTTTVLWTAEVIDATANSWLVITNSSNNGAGAITLELAENDSFARRHAFIAVAANEINRADTILVVQKGGKNYLNTDASTAVMIGNVRWATRNLDEFGIFTDDATDAGGHFDMTDKSQGRTAWAILNNPCPCDWRLPTVAEMNALRNAGHHGHRWEDTPAGRWFGASTLSATFAKPGNNVFLPATLSGNTEGMYWTGTITINEDDEEVGEALIFDNQDASIEEDLPLTTIFSVRCVTDRR